MKQGEERWCYEDEGQVAHVRSYQGHLEAHPPLNIFSCIWIEFNSMGFSPGSHQGGGGSGAYEGTMSLGLGGGKEDRAMKNFLPPHGWPSDWNNGTVQASFARQGTCRPERPGDRGNDTHAVRKS